MKRICAFLVALILVLNLTGCLVIVPETYRLLYGVEEIETIAIYDLGEKSVESLDDSLEPVGYIPKEQYESFANSVEYLPYTNTFIIVLAAIDSSFSFSGYVFKVSYQNGGYEIITSGARQPYRTAEGKERSYSYECDEEVWLAFVKQYLEE